ANCVSNSEYQDKKEKILLFTGNLQYPPNLHGLEWFVEKVFPPLIRAEPSIEIQVVSRNIPLVLKRYQAENVAFITNCDDINTYLLNASLAIVPLHSGAGTRLKILEAVAAGTPVVSTTIGAEGLPVKNNAHL